MYNKDLDFRYAKREDTALILQFIKELADYEKMLNEVVADEKHWRNGFLINKRQK